LAKAVGGGASIAGVALRVDDGGTALEGAPVKEHPTRADMEAAAPAVEVKFANLALQGGGAHGAFTWGVLDRLLEEPRFAIEGVSATSSGAMNAVVLAHGLTAGGREGARHALHDFWRRVAEAGQVSPLQPSWYDQLTHNYGLDHSPGYLFFDLLSRMFSPYQFNPYNYNPLQSVLEATVDFERLRHECAIKLFLCATNVRTGKVKVFDNNEVCVTPVLASACLPLLHQAVEIDGEHYWDGGYMGNPALFPLIYACSSCDIIVIHINPTERCEIPKTAQEILSRINEVSFNSSLLREMRAIAFVTKLIDDGKVNDTSLKRILIHAIEADDVMCGLGVASKLNATWEFLTHLRDIGRDRADKWLKTHFGMLGVDSTVDIRAKYL
jgi:NTE family protein